ncbi:MAG TPA: hypothetical protein VHJ18_04375 [Streptosporangiaceae bacterium]|jgi:hypothetical protein|nr:hypothetical protein [Streptosporangiaceae bacterium]
MLGADGPGAEVRVQEPSVFVPVLDQGDLLDGGGCGAVPDAGEPTGDGLVAVACAADDDGPPVEAEAITGIGEGIMKAGAVPVAACRRPLAVFAGEGRHDRERVPLVAAAVDWRNSTTAFWLAVQ